MNNDNTQPAPAAGQQLREAVKDELIRFYMVGTGTAGEAADRILAAVSPLLAAKEAEDKALFDWIKANVENIDFHVKVPAGCFATNPFIAHGTNFRDAIKSAKKQMEAL